MHSILINMAKLFLQVSINRGYGIFLFFNFQNYDFYPTKFVHIPLPLAFMLPWYFSYPYLQAYSWWYWLWHEQTAHLSLFLNIEPPNPRVAHILCPAVASNMILWETHNFNIHFQTTDDQGSKSGRYILWHCVLVLVTWNHFREELISMDIKIINLYYFDQYSFYIMMLHMMFIGVFSCHVL